MAAIYNNNPNRKKGSQVFNEDDFLPKKKGKRSVGKSAEEMLAAIQWRHAAIHAQAKVKK